MRSYLLNQKLRSIFLFISMISIFLAAGIDLVVLLILFFLILLLEICIKLLINIRIWMHPLFSFSYFANIFKFVINKVYSISELFFYPPPKPHSFASLPLESNLGFLSPLISFGFLAHYLGETKYITLKIPSFFSVDKFSLNNGMIMGLLNSPFSDDIVLDHHPLPLWLVILSCFPIIFITGISILTMDRIEFDQYLSYIGRFFVYKMSEREPNGKIKVFLVYAKIAPQTYFIWDASNNLRGEDINHMLGTKGVIQSMSIHGTNRHGVIRDKISKFDTVNELISLTVFKPAYDNYSPRYTFYTNSPTRLGFEQTSLTRCKFVIGNNPLDKRDGPVIREWLRVKGLNQ